jgi:DNA-binding MarR family transcriptional regulator
MSSLGQALRGYQTALDGFDEAICDLLGVNRTDLRCLDLLSLDQPMSAGELARASGLTSGAVTFVVDRLERGGFVVRRRDPNDRRRVLVECVPEASERIFALHRPLVMDFRAAVELFQPLELAAIERFLNLGQEAYARHARELRARAGGNGKEGRPT